jgi:Cysteine dioxygenase type I
VREWIGERVPAGRELDREELAALAAAIGRERTLWADVIVHDPDERTFTELYRDVNVDVWVQGWMNQQDTGYHDHDLSSGAVFVSDGVLVEDRLQRVDGAIRGVPREHAAGSGFDFDAACIHRMHHVSGPHATSIHCYSPAIWRMGHYSFDDDGVLHRRSVTYADEMWTGRVKGLQFTP